MRGRWLAPVALASLSLGGCGGGSGNASGPVSTATPAPTPTPSPTGTPTEVFADEFNAAELDRSKWNVVGMDFWVNSEQQAYLDTTDTIFIRSDAEGAEGGVLVLKPIYRPGVDTRSDRNADFISGRIDSSDKFDFEHGRAEARIRMSDAQGFWPAFWLLGYGAWPDSGEIDIMEYVGEKEWVSSALHGPGYSGNTPINARYTFPAGQDVTAWHTYAVEWDSNRIVFEVDGNAYYTVTKADVERYGAWRFDNRKYLILNAALGGTYPNGVNAVTTPYFGLPQASVDRIKAGEVEIEIDWVRVTQLR
ncbi:glycoside hydrolase family 16 protein [Qipengyuania sphaerica]|uniref:glycoside hydrolase family 16 protein n=1 Tax=Qipengyuania sphaerica TaxID=2867243 RepID=UPI001C880930|nr:glycoside hydrolase family 16 protein [Qipengyuania sphaerica]MBX7539639.1 glycoside hydrolase family 16 protein [Qipengyuania sphaerica]